MRVSVVLSTYNGEAYIEELMNSLLHQTAQIDEVLILDDASSDSTVSIIEAYIKSNHLDNWHLTRNQINCGWKKNFYNLILQADGDFIFPCDQDDIWMPDKIIRMIELMNCTPDAKLICCDYEVFYMDGSTAFPNSQVSAISDSGIVEKLQLKKAVKIVDRPGCTYCLRKTFIPFMKAVWFEDCPHDALAWRTASVYDGLYILHKKLVRFRRHDNNASDKKEQTISDRENTAHYLAQFMDALIGLPAAHEKGKINHYLNKCRDTQLRREHYLKNRSLVEWLLSLSHISYMLSLHSYVGDGVCIFKGTIRKK